MQAYHNTLVLYFGVVEPGAGQVERRAGLVELRARPAPAIIIPNVGIMMGIMLGEVQLRAAQVEHEARPAQRAARPVELGAGPHRS